MHLEASGLYLWATVNELWATFAYSGRLFWATRVGLNNYQYYVCGVFEIFVTARISEMRD